MARISERTNPDISADRGHIKHYSKKSWVGHLSLVISIIALLKAYHII